VWPLRGENPQNRPLSKLNNRHFALRAMLPVNNSVAVIWLVTQWCFELAFSFFQDFMGKSDPYLEFSRQMSDGKFVAVHRTEVFKPYFLDFTYLNI